MVTGWHIYWITRLDSIKNLVMIPSIVLLVLGIIALFVVLPEALTEEDSVTKKVFRFAKTVVPMAFLGLGLVTMLPGKKDAIAIWVAPKILNNEDVQALPQDALKLVRKQLTSWIEDFDTKEE